MILCKRFYAAVLVLATGAMFAQQTTPPAPATTAGRGAGRGGGRGGPRIPPMDEAGFQPIFDGKTLAGWDGDPAFWRVENGSIVGQTFADKQPKQNTFLIWRGGSPADFELKLQYKLIGHNSGIQMRSIELPDIKYAMKGYQADMDAAQQYPGQFYEERGRGCLAMRGQFSYIGESGKPARKTCHGRPPLWWTWASGERGLDPIRATSLRERGARTARRAERRRANLRSVRARSRAGRRRARAPGAHPPRCPP